MGNIEKYFAGEKFQCSIGLICGIAEILLSIYLISLHKPALKGLSFTVIPTAFLISAVCVGIVLRAPKDINRVTGFFQTEPVKIKTEELPRMEKVMKNFPVIKKVEIVILILGLLLALVFWKNELLRGIGIGLLIQGILLYCFDHFAEARGRVYLEFLKSIAF